jgi:hypothetical protein
MRVTQHQPLEFCYSGTAAPLDAISDTDTE